MNATTRKHRLLIIAVLLAVLSSAQIIHAQDYSPGGCTVEIPQWVRDRQQYETTYVYMQPAVENQDAAGMAEIPPWVRDRQQYETSFVYAPQSVALQSDAKVTRIPQWAIDRQQYETTYVYKTPATGLRLEDARCSAVQTLDS